MKINLTSSLTIQADQDLRAASASSEQPTTGANGFAVALYIRRSREDLARSESEATVRAAAPQDTVSFSPDLSVIYKCKNCGKRMKLSDAASYYGIPACPACVQACAPFEIIPENSDSHPGSSGKS